MKDIEKEIISTIGKHADDLLNQNWDGIAEMLKETPDGKIKVGLAVSIDWSEAAPKVKTVISYSRNWKDEREDELEDPQQQRLNLTGVTIKTGETELRFGNGEPDGPHGDAKPAPGDDEPETEPPTPDPEADAPKAKRGRKRKLEAVTA